tara:strand:- start:340 stop:1017 length:678 start_codon:yes stop_codon:yes gene_type:complete
MLQTSVITIGNNLAALQHAHQQNSFLILNKLAFPEEFEKVSVKSAWGLLYAHLMLQGRIIGGDSVRAIGLKEENMIVVCDSNIINKIKFDKAYIFSDEKITGLPPTKKEVDLYRVVDYIRPVYLRIKDTDSIYTKDNFVAELHVIKEHATAPVKLYSVSNLKKEDLTNFDSSDTMVRFKCESLLVEHGHKGDRDALIQLEVIKRTVTKFMNEYEETDRIEFIYGN